MNTLLIHKKGEKLFWHTHNNLPSTLFAISDFDISIDGNKFKITERNGSMRYEYDVTNVQVKNLANPNESFVSGEQLYNRLFQLNYIPFLGYNSGNTVTYVQENPIIGIGTITRTVNDFTFSVGFKWKINAIIYQNASPIVRTIYAATTGYFRIDIAVMDTNNDIIIIQGDEVDAIEAVQAPLTPENTVYLTSWFISGSTVNNPDEVYPGNIFVEKEEFVNIYLSDASGSITIDLDQKATKFILTDDATTEINGFNPSSEFLSEFLRPDHVISITNRSATPKTLKHLVGSWKMQFPDETDLTLPPNYRANFIVETHDGITFVYFNGMNKLGGSQDLQQVLENGGTYTSGNKSITITERGIILFDAGTLSQMEFGLGDSPENQMYLIFTPNAGGQTELSFPKTESTENVAYQSYVDTGLSDKVDKVTGKQLSTEDYTTSEKSKLAGIASGATANDTDANLLNRANHTGSQAISTITGLQDELDAKDIKHTELNLLNDYALSSITTAQKLFNVGTSGNGAFSLDANSLYEFEMFVYLDNLSTISSNFSFQILGTATYSNILLKTEAIKQAFITGSVFNGIITATTSYQLVTNSTASTGFIRITGSFRTSSAGTFIPSILLSVANAANVKKGSYAKIKNIGSDTFTATSGIS